MKTNLDDFDDAYSEKNLVNMIDKCFFRIIYFFILQVYDDDEFSLNNKHSSHSVKSLT